MWPETGPRVAMFPVRQMQKTKAPVLDFIVLVLVEFSCRLHSQNAAKIAQSMLNLTPKKNYVLNTLSFSGLVRFRFFSQDEFSSTELGPLRITTNQKDLTVQWNLSSKFIKIL